MCPCLTKPDVHRGIPLMARVCPRNDYRLTAGRVVPDHYLFALRPGFGRCRWPTRAWRRASGGGPFYRASMQLEHHESNAKIEFTWLTGVVVMFVW